MTSNPDFEPVVLIILSEMDADKIKSFQSHVVEVKADPSDLGFKDLRLGIGPASCDQEEIWNWFGNHGCYIGGTPMAKGYVSSGLVAEATTPFECLYYVYRGTRLPPLLAHRLRRDVRKHGPCYDGKNSRVWDPMECLSWEGDANAVTIHLLRHKANPPEAEMSVPEEYFLTYFGDLVQKWVSPAVPPLSNPACKRSAEAMAGSSDNPEEPPAKKMCQ